jgi:hypothetical protein
MAIDRNILYRKLEAFIDARYHAPDKNLIKDLCRIIIFNNPVKDCIRHSPQDAWANLPHDKSLFFSREGCGLPIGNLTSQVFANFYLTEFDHFIKHSCGIRDYGRYVDDCIIVHPSRAFLKNLVPKMREYLAENLGLCLHPKKIYLQRCCHGVRFLGCFIKPSHTVVHHRTLRNFARALRFYNALAADHRPEAAERGAFVSSVNSYLGILKHYKTYRKRRGILCRGMGGVWRGYVGVGAGVGKVVKKFSPAGTEYPAYTTDN